ncbi:MAG: type II secretion system F family protein [Coriobacteriia bacterium]|nr:type II secretion system F family protein [Coriobacteriia bacterium]
MLVLSALAVGASVCIVAYSVLSLVFSEERQVARRLARLTAFERMQAGEVEPLSLPFVDRVLRPLASGARHGVRLFAPRDYRSRLDRRLRVAGSPKDMDSDSLIVLKVLSALVVAAILWLLFLRMSDTSLLQALFLNTIAGVAGFFVPDLWLRARTSARQTSIRRSLPDMLDMLMISMQAGLGFDAALVKFLRNSTGPLAEEFTRVLQEINAGLSRRDALRNLSERTEVPELTTFVMAMVQADVFGISVSNVLSTQSQEMRTKRRQFAEELAQKAPAKMVFPLILCILPATLIVLMGPAVIAIGRAFGLIAGQ